VVICENCGCENDHPETGFCKKCLAPLKTDKSNPPAQKPADSHSMSEPQYNEQASFSNQINFDDNESADQEPVDTYASGISENENAADKPDFKADSDKSQKESFFEIKEVPFDESTTGLSVSEGAENDTSLIKNHTEDAGSKRPDADDIQIEKNLTLYRDDELQITMEQTADGPEITFANRSELGNYQKEQKQNQENTESNASPPPIDEEPAIDSTEEDRVTQKIIINPEIEKPKKHESGKTAQDNQVPSTPQHNLPEKPLPKSQPETKAESLPSSQATDRVDSPTGKSAISAESIKMSPLAQSRGVAYVSGNSIQFSGGLKPQPGMEISIDNKIYDLKEKQSRNMLLYAGVGAAILVILIIFGVLLNSGAAGDGQIVGMLNYPHNEGPVKGAIITVKELNRSVETNYAGFFVFDQIPPDIYTVIVNQEGVGILSEKMPVLNNKTSTLSFTLPSAEEITEQQNGGRDTRALKQEPGPSIDRYGFMKLTLSPSKAAVYLDGKYIGKGSQTFKVPEGKHKVTAKYGSYKETTKNVSIAYDQIKSYTFQLQQIKRSAGKNRAKSNEELATELEEQGRYSEALKYYDKILAGDDNNIEALIGQARCHKAGGDSKQALASFLKASQVAKTKNDTPSQLSALTGVIEINPNYLTARYSRGLIYMDQGEHYRAAQDFAKVIEIDKRNLNAYYMLGEAYYRAQNYPAALEAYQNVQSLNFADVKPFAYMAMIYMKMDDRKNMKKCYEKFDESADMTTKIKFDSEPEWKEVKKKIGK
jgi:tetratricopeptide (TPR) repeat protein